MAIRETAAIAPATLSLRGHAKSAIELAIAIESALAAPLRTLSLAADWIEHRHADIDDDYDIVDETVIFADATSAAIAITLPPSSTETINRDIHIKKVDSVTANAVTITPQPGDTIDGLASIAITEQGQSFHLLSDGLGSWRVLSTIAASSSGGVTSPATAAPIIVNLTAAAVGTSVKYAREDHRHLFDVTINPTGANAWTGTHAWLPSSNAVPVTINKTASLTSADILRVEDTDDGAFLAVDNTGFIGINCEPDIARVTIQGNLAAVEGLVAWYRSTSITGLSDLDNLVTWPDDSGNGHDLTASGVVSAGGGADARRPLYLADGTAYAFSIANLPAVSFYSQPDIVSNTANWVVFFTIDGGPIVLSRATGFTIFAIIRDGFITAIQILTQDNMLGGISATDGSHSVIETKSNGDVDDTGQWSIDAPLGDVGDEVFSSAFAHVEPVTEYIIWRCAAGGALDMWLNGVQQSGGGTAANTSYSFRYLGRRVIGTSSTGMPSRSLAELGILERPITDDECATLNTYMAGLLAGDSPAVSFPLGSAGDEDLTHWRDSTESVLSRIDAAGQFGFGVAPEVPIHIVQAGEQLRIGPAADDYTGFQYAGSEAILYTLPATNALATVGVLHNSIPAAGASTWSWSLVSLTADVSGILPLANGGTNANLTAVNGGIVWSDANSLEITAAGTSGDWLRSGGAATPAWVTPGALTRTDDTNVTLTLGGSASTALLNAASLTLGWTGELSITRGGTGQSTALAAFNALSPLTTRGDMLTRDASNNVRIAIAGSSGKFWKSDGTDPSWQTITTSDVSGFAHNLLSASHSDTVAASPVHGDLIFGNSTPAWQSFGYQIAHDTNTATYANLFLGKNAGNFTTTGGTQGNYTLGEEALVSVTSGGGNVALGYQSLYDLTEGTFNFALGEAALYYITTGADNVGIGAGSGQGIVTGSGNISIGSYSMTDGDYDNTVAIGYGVVVDAANKVVIGNTPIEDFFNIGTDTVELRGGYLKIYCPLADRRATLDFNSTANDIDYIFPGDSGGGTVWIDNSVDGWTMVDNPIVSWTPAAGFGSGAGGGIRVYAGGGGFSFQFQQDTTNGNVTANVGGGSPGGWTFSSSGTPTAVVTVSGNLVSTTFNNLTITNNTVGTQTLDIALNKTLDVNNSLTLAGSDGTTMTFPSTSATIARTDAAQTFTGVQTFSAQDVHNAGIDLGSSGSLVAGSAVPIVVTTSLANSGTVQNFTVRNTISQTGITRALFSVDWNSSGTPGAAYQPAFQVIGGLGTQKATRLYFDASNYATGVVNSTGTFTFTCTGSSPALNFTASQTVAFTSSAAAITFSAATTSTLTAATSITLNSASVLMKDGCVMSNVANTTGFTLMASGDKFGLWGQTPTTKPAALTQTYSTATGTHVAVVATAVATTAATNITPFGYTTQAQADDIIAQLNALRLDLIETKKFLNQVVDDLQSYGALW